MGKLLTQEEARQKYLNNGYEMIGEYNGRRERVKCKSIIDGLYYDVCEVGDSKTSLWANVNKNNFIINANIIAEEKCSDSVCVGYEYSKSLKLKFICSCGQEFYVQATDLKTLKYIKCKKCCNHLRGRTKAKKIDVIYIIKKAGYKVLERPKDLTLETRIPVEDHDGYRGYLTGKQVKNKKYKMLRFHVNKNKENYIYNINVFLSKMNSNSKCISNDGKLLTIECSCGQIFETSFDSMKICKRRCDKCSRAISKYEYLVSDFLDEQNIEYKREWKFKDCIHKRQLPFDFYIPEKNMCIEVDGEFHYQEKIGIQTKEQYKERKMLDDIKTLYCEENNITLLRIPYWCFPEHYKNKILVTYFS